MKWFIKILLLLIASQYWGCKKDCPCDDPSNKECPNYDPCLSIQKPTANFNMRQTSPGFPDPETELMPEFCDTIRSPGVQFVADMDGALDYTWKIGADPREFKGKIIFTGFLPMATIILSYQSIKHIEV